MYKVNSGYYCWTDEVTYTTFSVPYYLFTFELIQLLRNQ